MKKVVFMLVIAFTAVMVISGCGQSQSTSDSGKTEVKKVESLAKIGLKFNEGDKDKIKYTKDTLNRVWVEMKGKEPSETGRRTTELEFIVTREVESVDDEGAVLKLTFDEVKLSLESNVQKKTKENSYISTADKTSSTWKGEPAVAGKSVKVKVDKAGSVLEFIGLDELFKELRIEEDDNSRVSWLVGKESLTNIVERPFLKACADGNVIAEGWDNFEEIPDAMLNAKALRFIYTPVDFNKGDKVLTVKTKVEPLYTVPEGMPEPPAAGDPFKMILKQNSDLQEPVVESETVFDIEAGKVEKDMVQVDYLMILDGNKLFPEQRTGNKKDVDAGMMFTQIKIKENFEVIE